MNQVDNATQRQIDAARPNYSTWLSANAGSGKTRVLTDRVARLLLDGVSPQNILCLTYTKAAASEMQNRLFKRLGEWTLLPTDRLSKELTDLGVDNDLSETRLENARSLFARAIETPGGLKIQTIHSFCSAILRRFPLEAGVNPNFTEMDDRAQKMILAELLEVLADGDGPSCFDGIAEHYTGGELNKFLASIIGAAADFENADPNGVWPLFGLRQGYSEQDLFAEVLHPGDLNLVTQLRSFLLACDGNDGKAGLKLLNSDVTSPSMDLLAELEAIFLSGPKTKNPNCAKIGSFPTKKNRDGFAGLALLENLMARFEAARQTRLGLLAAQRTKALYDFALEFLKLYDARKTALGLLDFNDLIQKTRALLQDEAVAAWVLYRLDGGIDHILVDEAQDTSPAQWDVIRNLTQEITSGQGAREDTQRTVFAVGDKKQSIYSFQGADPDEFDRMEVWFKDALTQIGALFQPTTLSHSFRSSAAVLNVVDHVFSKPNGLGAKSDHIAFKSTLPGRVDVWPVVPPPLKADPKHWTDPIDEISEDHQDRQLAQSLASFMKDSIANETITQLDDDGRPFQRRITAGDFLILVQGRQRQLFREVHLACKAADLPIAGADRLKVAAELAVKDLTSLLAFLALPEDNLALAEALRSPLFGWSEQDMYNLAQGRKAKYLWRELQNRKDDFPETNTALDSLRKLSDFQRPYEILEFILTNMGGRQKLLSRLGSEAEEGIDALLAQSLNYERANTPSLTGFNAWLEADDLEIKRQMDAVGDQIRVMTVHGAKGLEAPIVILPDTAKRNAPSPPEVMTLNGQPIWRPNAPDMPDILVQSKSEYQKRQTEERDRLLYVAMTRAESWLIVAGAGDIKPDHACWYNSIQSAVSDLGGVPIVTQHGAGLRYEPLGWAKGQLETPQVKQPTTQTLPTWANAVAEKAVTIPEPRSPSELGGDKVVIGWDPDFGDTDPLIYGTAVHVLLEHGLSAQEQVDPDFMGKAVSEAASVLTNPNLSHIFAENALSEVEFTVRLDELSGQTVYGAIDRLIVTDTDVTIVDFKTNRIVPDTAENTPNGLLRQMGAYVAAGKKIFPDHNIKSQILWTKTGTLMDLPHHIVMDALQSTTVS